MNVAKTLSLIFYHFYYSIISCMFYACRFGTPSHIFFQEKVEDFFRLLKFLFQDFALIENLSKMENSFKNNGLNIKITYLNFSKCCVTHKWVGEMQRSQFLALHNYWIAPNVFQNCLKYYFPSLSLGGLL